MTAQRTRPLFGHVLPWVVAALATGLCFAATPPPLVSYQGVLRDASDAPLTGSYDMVFRLFDAQAAGNEILVDQHLAVNGMAVQVTGGLFTTQIGSGQVLDGSGPGVYTSLADVFRDYTALWLEVQIGAETLSPRTRVVAAGYALNAANLEGRPASRFLDTSTTAQFKGGPLTVTASAPTSTGITSGGTSIGGVFFDSDGTGYAYVGKGDNGIEGYGNLAGGYFKDASADGQAYIGYGSEGIYASGPLAGGEFHYTGYGSEGDTYVGIQGKGILAYGTEPGRGVPCLVWHRLCLCGIR